MKIICDKKILSYYLNIVSKAVSSKTPIAILESILLTVSNNEFKLTANNLEIAIESNNIEAKIEKEGRVALDANLFINIIRKLPEGDITIECDGNYQTTITCLKSEYKILGQSAEDFPLLADVERQSPYKIKQKEFKELIKKTSFSISKDETKPVFTGELLELNENKISLVAIDGFRISYAKVNCEDKNIEDNVIIPGDTLNEISKLIDDDEEFLDLYLSENHALFVFPDFKIVTRVLDGEFLKYELSFIMDYTTKVWINRLAFLEAIERVSIISHGTRKDPVRISISENLMQLKTKSEIGTAFEEILISLEGEELEIGFNPDYLKDPLKVIEDDEIVLLFNSAISPCIIYNEENDNYKYLVLPLKL